MSAGAYRITAHGRSDGPLPGGSPIGAPVVFVSGVAYLPASEGGRFVAYARRRPGYSVESVEAVPEQWRDRARSIWRAARDVGVGGARPEVPTFLRSPE